MQNHNQNIFENSVSKYFVFKQTVTGIVLVIANSFVQLYDISFQVPPSTSETY